MPVIEGGQVLRGGQDFGGVLGGQVLYGGQEIEPEQGGRTQPDSEAVEMSVGPFRRNGAPPNGWYNGVADKGAITVDIVTGTHYTNTGTKAATVWTADAPSGGGSGVQVITVDIDSADLLDLHNTPVDLVAAPNAGEVQMPIKIVARGTRGPSGGVAYTVDPATELDVTWGDVTSALSTSPHAELLLGLDAGEVEDYETVGYFLLSTDQFGGIGSAVGAPLRLWAYGPLTGGTASLQVTVTYETLPARG